MLSATGSGVSVKYNNGSLDLYKDGWILITNLEKNTQTLPPQTGDDWKKHRAATTGDVDDIAKYYPHNVRCNTPAPQGRWTAEVLDLFPKELVDTSECTDTHWP
jgi:hypothetical protein